MTAAIGVSFDGFATFGDALDIARDAVGRGARSLWMAEHLGYRQSVVSCMAFLMATERAAVVPTAISPYMWHPMPVAMALATMAEAAPGRVGVALGSGNPMFLKESGLEIEKPLRVMREFIECLKALWAGDAVQYQGETVQLAGARMAFEPPAPVVVYVAAMGPQMLRLAGRIADGVALSAGLSTDYAASSLRLAEEGANKAGRDFEEVRKAAWIYFSVSRDGRRAIDAVRGKLAFLLRNKFLAENVRESGIPIDQEAVMAAVARRDMEAATRLVPDEAAEAFAVAGTPQACRDRLQAYIDAGVDEPVLSILGDGEDRALALQLVEEVTPA